MSIQVNLDEISIEQADVWMKDVEEKLSEALREVGKEMIGEAFQGIINSKAPKRGCKVMGWQADAQGYKAEAKIALA